MEIHDTDYGSRDYSARDPEGNLWHFGTYWPDVSGQGSIDSRKGRSRP